MDVLRLGERGLLEARETRDCETLRGAGSQNGKGLVLGSKGKHRQYFLGSRSQMLFPRCRDSRDSASSDSGEFPSPRRARFRVMVARYCDGCSQFMRPI